MVIDCHCHAGQGDGLTGPWDTSAPLPDYLRRASAAGVAVTNLIPAFHSDYAVANRYVGELRRRYPRRFTAFVGVHAERDKGRARALIQGALTDYGVCGIKVHRHDARISREILDAARALRLPVLYDLVGEIPPIELLAREYPEVAFIVPHLGSFADDWRAQLQLIDHLHRHPNVYADTSGVRRFDLLLEAVRRAGPHKLLFGSDGPWLHPAVELAKIDALGLSRAARALITRDNFLRLTQRARSAAAPRSTARRCNLRGLVR